MSQKPLHSTAHASRARSRHLVNVHATMTAARTETPRGSVVQQRSAELREHILDVASDLFYKHGVRNVGIDRIISESGIARMTLYNHFKSKDLLIQEYLTRKSREWVEWYRSKITKASDDPRARILAAFDVLDGWFRSKNFRGCSVANAVVELADADHPVADVKKEYHGCLRALFRGLAEEAGADKPEELAEELFLLLRGAMSSALLDGPKGVSARCRRTAEHLLAAHLRS